MAITSQIVQVDATVTSAPSPSTLQQSGAIVSVGGTTQTTGTYTYYSTLTALVAALSSAGNYLEVTHMATTFFAQGNEVGVYVLELGVVASAPAGITALNTWIVANPGNFYAYLVPATWDASGAALNTMAANYSSPTGKTYFFVTTTSGTLSAYTATTKAIVAIVPSPTAASSEFQAAAFFYQWLSNLPAIASPSPPMGFRYVYGVTPWTLNGNGTTISTILTAFGNIILSGAEGGISTATLRNGTTMDGNQMMFWYAVDWLEIQAQQLLANAIINGSNSNPPLYYNQAGINTLLAILDTIGFSGTSFGLLLAWSFAATPFAAYTAANPADYAAGKYAGFSGTVYPQRGFEAIVFFLDAVTFA
jgi:hypothetical protein